MVLVVVAAKLRVSIPEASMRRSLPKTRSVVEEVSVVISPTIEGVVAKLRRRGCRCHQPPSIELTTNTAIEDIVAAVAREDVVFVSAGNALISALPVRVRVLNPLCLGYQVSPAAQGIGD
jgi:hypothetical protein